MAISRSFQSRRIARGEITATGTLSEAPDELLARLDADGRVQFPIAVELTDADGEVVAAMMIHWHVRRNA